MCDGVMGLVGAEVCVCVCVFVCVCVCVCYSECTEVLIEVLGLLVQQKQVEVEGCHLLGGVGGRGVEVEGCHILGGGCCGCWEGGCGGPCRRLTS